MKRKTLIVFGSYHTFLSAYDGYRPKQDHKKRMCKFSGKCIYETESSILELRVVRTEYELKHVWFDNWYDGDTLVKPKLKKWLNERRDLLREIKTELVVHWGVHVPGFQLPQEALN